jgi:dienelactone hydrolase
VRCAKYPERDRIPEAAFGPVSFEDFRDYASEKPVPEEVFQVYRDQFLYDPSALNVEVGWKREAEDWTEERITFDAPYGNERMIAYLFLPKKAEPPYQTVIYFPGGGVLISPNDHPYQFQVLDFITKNGRAVLYPIYKGTHERRVAGFDTVPRSGHEYKDYVVLWVKEFKRSIDYLETRFDIDNDKLAYYGFSWGGWMGVTICAVEPRLKASILYVGGLRPRTPPRPEVDPFHYAPRVTVPTLMLNGRYDFSFPLKLAVLPLHELLGTREEDKSLILYDTDHFIPRKERIKESLAWLDRYLGPVE